MGIEKIAMKVRGKKSDGLHADGKLPGTKDIEKSLDRFKKDVKPIEKRPLEKKAEKEAEPVGSILKRMLKKGKGDPSKGVPSGDKRNPLPEAEKKETPKQEKAEEKAEKATPAKKIEAKLKGSKPAPAAPPAKEGFSAILAKMKAKGK
jgi:hypothetical protein